jgi:hypothetical protein
MGMNGDSFSLQFKQLCDEWGNAIRTKNEAWFRAHFAEDFLGTAQPWPTLRVNKEQMIDLDKKVEKMDVHWIEVTARKFGPIVLTYGVVHYNEEVFVEGATFGEGMPTGQQLSALVNGKGSLYIGAWRQIDGVWQIFDHHMVCVLERSWRD